MFSRAIVFLALASVSTAEIQRTTAAPFTGSRILIGDVADLSASPRMNRVKSFFKNTAEKAKGLANKAGALMKANPKAAAVGAIATAGAIVGSVVVPRRKKNLRDAEQREHVEANGDFQHITK